MWKPGCTRSKSSRRSSLAPLGRPTTPYAACNSSHLPSPFHNCHSTSLTLAVNSRVITAGFKIFHDSWSSFFKGSQSMEMNISQVARPSAED